ncbi:MAG: hypothetical protein IPK11_16410 [Ignavibacteria bacterium]|jgi:hypothetical protein|nr:hypothetical protein [Ignavibacteria bacterium]TXH60804.1 MAG: hypothetical protein E6Q89_00295 [Bacteroidia bacterium]
MDNSKKIVTQIPINNLWRDNQSIFAKRNRYLTADDIKRILRKYPLEFVVACIGEKLKWISYDKSFDFWKTEIKPHLVDDINNINLDSYLDNYAYVASEWMREIETQIILLEKYH